MSPAGGKHGRVTMNLSTPLDMHVRAADLGVVLTAETGFRLAGSPDTVLAPDISFVRRERIPTEGIPEAYWELAPDLVVEVLSPNDTAAEIEEKIHEWLVAGTLAVVLVNPKRHGVTVHRPGRKTETLTEKDILDLDDVVPGFCIGLAAIFA